MKKRFKAISQLVVVFTTGLVTLSSCVSDPDSSGLEYTPDMYRSPAIEPYVDYAEIKGLENKDLKVLQSAMRPPHETIPYYGTDSLEVAIMLPYHRKASSASNSSHGLYEKDGWRLSDSLNTEYEKAKKDKNPIVLTEENSESILDEGKKIYASKCQHCHGEKGDGQGQMMVNGTYAGVPDYKNLSELGDGQIFYSIYYGKGAMGAHSMMLDKKEMWTLVHYVNKFRFDDYGDFGSDEESDDEENAQEEEESVDADNVDAEQE
ncbi:MAG: cytochrome c [Brumimicrobium sp.]